MRTTTHDGTLRRLSTLATLLVSTAGAAPAWAAPDDDPPEVLDLEIVAPRSGLGSAGPDDVVVRLSTSGPWATGGDEITLLLTRDDETGSPTIWSDLTAGTCEPPGEVSSRPPWERKFGNPWGGFSPH
ncbi:hypothetical protein [Isoptericola sp. 178]|uniref:hypothetical protein n=1 Tax=Isoptericola sp. 178 TaxID=3064651 RepID=UPI002712EA2E|nr:hypothetical protein [Isoptericola sp. 178]MDO8145888.1 hypothetical protein [Isoptericola sp. 178]